MGEPRKVEVGLVDLKVLVREMFEIQVKRLAEVMVLNEPGNTDADAAFEFVRQVSEKMPEARKKQERRYHRLLEALESGVDVGPALKAFLHRDRRPTSDVSRGSSPFAISSCNKCSKSLDLH